jgi:signal transduction histidine kinase
MTPAAEFRTLLRRAARPPLGDHRFWIVQGLVLVVGLLHVLADLGLAVPPLGIPTFATVALFLIPIVYAALNFGLSGSLATAAWIALLTLPDLALVDAAGDRWDDSLQLAVVVAVALFVGQRVDRERFARERAEAAEAESRTYAARVLESQEEERRRLAHELHDDPLQDLTRIGRRLEALAEDRTLPAHLKRELEDLQDVARDTSASLREITRGLRPPSLDDLGLTAAVRQLVVQAEARDGLGISFDIRGEPRRLQPALELGLYRIVQEALHNVERHAGARLAAVVVGFESERVTLQVSDDGRGFDVEHASASLGLPGMSERAALLGGTLRIDSSPGAGTRVTASVPAPAA